MTTPWQPQGNVHTLGESAITRLVPTLSGVYGLHDEHQQLFIGEAADLRQTLLLHCLESERLFSGRQPTHFSFEVCDANTRAQLAERLIAEYRPAVKALQPPSTSAVSAAKSKGKSITRFAASPGETAALPQWPQAAGTDDANSVAQAKYFSRAQLASLVALFMVTAGVSGYLGIVTGQNLRARRLATWELSTARRPVLDYMTAESKQVSSDSNSSRAPRNDANSDAQPIDATSAAATGGQLPFQFASAASADGDAATAIAKRAVVATPVGVTAPATVESKPPAEPTASKEPVANNWSVQIAATQDQKAAQQLQDKLKNKGFDAYIVEADLNSGRWYRLRVGRFGAHDEAEATRQALQSKENIRSAFVTAK